MYNEERKLRFIEEAKRSKDYAKSVFHNLGCIEEELDKDLCEIPVEVLQPVVNQRLGVRSRSVEVGLSILKDYERWSKEQGYPVCGGIGLLKVDMADKMRRLMVASPQHLESIMDAAFDPVDSETVDCLYRCYLWMAFSGFSEDESLSVKVSEIDFDSMMIHHNGKSLDIYREAVPAFRMACTAEEFVYKHKNYTSRRGRFLGALLMRGIRSDSIKLHTARSFIQKKFDAKGIETSYGRIYLSGIFYKAYETERYGVTVSFDDAIMNQLANSEGKFHSNYTRNKAANAIKKDLFDDYEHWKEAFRV